MPQRAAARGLQPTGRQRQSAFQPIRAKLDPPRQRDGLVERSRLLDRLARSAACRFVSVIAPPGYGKTTVLGQWAGRDPRAFAWLSLDHRDNDPVVLFSYVAEALNGDGSIPAPVRKALGAPGNSLWTDGLPRLGAALAARKEPVVLVLDDVHLLQDDRSLDALAALSLHVPAGSQMVFAGRTEPRLGFARMRVEGDLHEVNAEALALGDREAAELLAAAGVDVTPAEASELNRHAEGWAAGLYLAALSIAKGGSSPASFDGSDRFVTDYLRTEELGNVTQDDHDFLVRSAVLESMSGPLCDTVLERSDSTAMLERLEGENLFVVPLDNTRTWFRYHHLFREMLQSELERQEPGAAAAIQRRAAVWCERQGWAEDAIDYAAAAGDMGAYARLVTKNTAGFFRAGRVTTVERWLASFDDRALLASHPEVAVLGAWLHALRGRPAPAERWTLSLDACDPLRTMSDGSTLDCWAATVRAMLCRSGVEQMQADAQKAVDGLTADSPLRSASLVLLGVSTRLLDEDGAAEILEQAADAATIGASVWSGIVARCELALLALERGDVSGAEAEIVLAREFFGDGPSADYVITALESAVTARLAIRTGKGARARQALASAQRLRPMLTHALPWFSVRVLLELAEAHLELGDPRGAATLYYEAAEILRRRPRLGRLVSAADEIHNRIPSTPDASSGWAATLTTAELRLLPLLTTHLSFREIAERLFVSRNTVKTQAISIYRKLDASSRSEAIERAVALGLVDAAPAANAADFTRSG